MSKCSPDVGNIFDLDAFPEDDLLVTDAPVGWYAIVSHKIVKEGLPVRFMYREHQGNLPLTADGEYFLEQKIMNTRIILKISLFIV